MLIGFISIFLLMLDCVAIHLISKDELSDKSQKILQTLLVVFIPLLGALIVIFINKAKPTSTGKYQEHVELDNGIGSFSPRSRNEVDLGGGDSD